MDIFNCTIIGITSSIFLINDFINRYKFKKIFISENKINNKKLYRDIITYNSNKINYLFKEKVYEKIIIKNILNQYDLFNLSNLSIYKLPKFKTQYNIYYYWRPIQNNMIYNHDIYFRNYKLILNNNTKIYYPLIDISYCNNKKIVSKYMPNNCEVFILAEFIDDIFYAECISQKKEKIIKYVAKKYFNICNEKTFINVCIFGISLFYLYNRI